MYFLASFFFTVVGQLADLKTCLSTCVESKLAVRQVERLNTTYPLNNIEWSRLVRMTEYNNQIFIKWHLVVVGR